MCSGDSVRCSVVIVGGYVCSGDSVRCSVVIVGGYVCSGDSVRCSVVMVGGYVCRGNSECLYGGCGVVILRWVCNGRTIENKKDEWTYLVQSLPEGED